MTEVKWTVHKTLMRSEGYELQRDGTWELWPVLSRSARFMNEGDAERECRRLGLKLVDEFTEEKPALQPAKTRVKLTFNGTFEAVNDWKTRATPIHALPIWENNVPFCTRDDCPEYDGKRCKLMGFRPDGICEPTVEAMGKLLEES